MSRRLSEADGERSRPMAKFFANPVVGVVGTIASVVGVSLAIFFGLQTLRHRELVYQINPAKTAVVKTGQTTRLRVLFEGEELRQDVTAVQVAVWNRGNESIRPENVLRAVTLTTEPKVPILEAVVRKESRDVVEFLVDSSDALSGHLPISWGILEKGDGATIQLVYAGGPEVKLEVSGVIEGQRAIHQADKGETLRAVGVIAPGCIVLFICMLAMSYLTQRLRGIGLAWWVSELVPLLAASGILFGALLVLSRLLLNQQPPFGF